MTEKSRTAGASRRRVVGGMAGGVLAAITNPVQAQQASAAAASAPAGPVSKQDPTKQYPQPPFKAQQQEWPGLAGKMEPRPDLSSRCRDRPRWPDRRPDCNVCRPCHAMSALSWDAPSSEPALFRNDSFPEMSLACRRAQLLLAEPGSATRRCRSANIPAGMKREPATCILLVQPLMTCSSPAIRAS